jgi:O-antigen ligase
LLKEGYAYLPGLASQAIYEFENAHGEEPSEEQNKPTVEKQDFTRLEETENREGGFFNGRVGMWVACLKTFKESPVFGVGYENLIERAVVYVEDSWKEHFRTGGSHNIYVCLLTSTGLLGFLLLGLFAAITLIKSGIVYLKKYKKASLWLLAFIAMCLMFYITEFVEARILFQVSTFSVIFWLFNGYMYSLAKLEEKE